MFNWPINLSSANLRRLFKDIKTPNKIYGN